MKIMKRSNFRTLQEIQQDMIDKITDLNMLPK